MLRREFLASVMVAPTFAMGTTAAELSPKSRIQVGRDTTFFSGPLDADGYVDYAAALDAHFGRDLKPADNAVVDLWKVLGPVKSYGEPLPKAYFRTLGCEPPPEVGVYFIPLTDLVGERRERFAAEFRDDPFWYQKLNDRYDTALESPWTFDQFPEIAEWLEVNEQPLERWRAASQQKRYFRPLQGASDDETDGSLFTAIVTHHEIGHLRDLARALRIRALRRAGEKKYAEAWSDLQAVRRWGRLIAQGPTMIDYMVGLTIEMIGTKGLEILVTSAQLSGEQRHNFRDDLERMPPRAPFDEKIEYGERCFNLDIVQLISRGKFKPIKGLVENVENITPEALAEIKRTDFSPTMRILNDWFDRSVALLRITDRPARAAAEAKYNDDLKRLQPRTPDEEAYREKVMSWTPGHIDAEELGRGLMSIEGGMSNFAADSAVRVDLWVELLKMVLAMCDYHAQHGRYPAALKDLAPQFLLRVVDDPFSGKPLVYRPAAVGFVLYSVGINGIDDDGQESNDDGTADDLAVRMPFVAPPPVNSLEQ